MPLNYNKDKEIIKKHENWIYKKLNNIKISQKEADNKELNYLLTETEFRDIVLLYIENLSTDLNVKVNKIYLNG